MLPKQEVTMSFTWGDDQLRGGHVKRVINLNLQKALAKEIGAMKGSDDTYQKWVGRAFNAMFEKIEPDLGGELISADIRMTATVIVLPKEDSE
jgi:hypothetical protein